MTCSCCRTRHYNSPVADALLSAVLPPLRHLLALAVARVWHRTLLAIPVDDALPKSIPCASSTTLARSLQATTKSPR